MIAANARRWTGLRRCNPAQQAAGQGRAVGANQCCTGIYRRSQDSRPDRARPSVTGFETPHGGGGRPNRQKSPCFGLIFPGAP